MKLFPNLPNKIAICKNCAMTHHLLFYGKSYLDATFRTTGVCEICNGFKPLFEARNQRRKEAFSDKKLERDTKKIQRGW